MAFRPLIIASLGLLVVLRLAGASTTADKLNGLLNNSPFGAARGNAAAGTGTGDPLEFRAVLEESGKQYYSIYDTATRRSTWVELNDPANGFSVKGYDAAHDTVTVEFRGKSMNLAIKRAAPVAQIAMPAPGIGPAGQVSPGGSGPTPIDQQRLQQVQEEIRRRRALRQLPQPGGNIPAGGPQVMPVNPGSTQPGPQLLPTNPANSQGGPVPLPANPSGTQSGPQPVPVPNIP